LNHSFNQFLFVCHFFFVFFSKKEEVINCLNKSGERERERKDEEKEGEKEVNLLWAEFFKFGNEAFSETRSETMAAATAVAAAVVGGAKATWICLFLLLSLNLTTRQIRKWKCGRGEGGREGRRREREGSIIFLQQKEKWFNSILAFFKKIIGILKSFFLFVFVSFFFVFFLLVLFCLVIISDSVFPPWVFCFVSVEFGS